MLRHMGQQVQPMEEETQEHGSGDGEFGADSRAAGDLAAAVGSSSSPLHDPVAAVGPSPLWNPDPAVAVGSASSALHDPDPAGLFPPCASSWVSWEDLVVVELGCGLALCSIVAAKLGAKVGDRVDMFSSAVPPFRWPHSTSSNIPPPPSHSGACYGWGRRSRPDFEKEHLSKHEGGWWRSVECDECGTWPAG